MFDKDLEGYEDEDDSAGDGGGFFEAGAELIADNDAEKG